ncbi:MAG: branched-chain amino acid aminotransferase [Clostridiales Family XIII bacterium]|jgi:branched-chain amino acid aminotransferase|nr:branched-chain amino acid aminotransferase [Clostridiales Family XIII bacterium]
MKYEIRVEKTPNPKAKPDPSTLEFGNVFTDHMFLMDYKEGVGWYDARIVPYGPIPLDPAACVLHYAQEMFEGLKTYKTKDGQVQLFRPDMNAARTNKTNERLCIPLIDEEFYVDAIKALVEFDKDWVPELEGTSLYIRPFIFGNEPFLGVRPSHTYIFCIILSPVGSYYKGGMAPTKIFVEDEYVRSVRGGTGFAKIGGNYATGLASQEKAHQLGFTQVLWLDGKEHKYIEEIGTSNAFFVMDGVVYTAPLEGTILPGITRDSVIQLLKDWNVPVKEERFTIDDVVAAHEAGKLDEVFASGTAAVISPVGELRYVDKDMIINDGKIGALSQKLYDAITGIQSGTEPDAHGWTVKLKD